MILTKHYASLRKKYKTMAFYKSFAIVNIMLSQVQNVLKQKQQALLVGRKNNPKTALTKQDYIKR